MKKAYLILGIIILIILIVILNLIQKPKGEEVEITLVKKGEIVSKVNAEGELKALSQVDISAETIARVKKIYYKEGDFVKRGSLLIELDDAQARANYKLAEAQLKQQEQTFYRVKSLYEKGLISQENFETAQVNFQSAQASYEQALDVYKKTKIYAPISGQIMKLNIEEGETAVMGTLNYAGTVLATIADMSRMIAVVKLDETEIPQIKPGQEAEVIADALPDSVFKGIVTKVGLMPITTTLTTEKATDFEVEIELNNFSRSLRPGMNVKAEIITNKKTDILTVPVQAVGKRKIKEQMAESVFLVKNKKAVLKEIQTGISSDTEMEILSGIVEGDTVIIGPYRILSKLKEGTGVELKTSRESQSAQ